MLQKIKAKVNKTIKEVKHSAWFNSKLGQENKKKLSGLEGLYSGRRCFVMGNGPSLLKCDLSKLKNEVTICSNAQFLIWDKMGFIPNFLTVEDRLVAEDRKDELNKLDSIQKVFPIDLAHFLAYDDKTIYTNFLRDYKNFPLFSENFKDHVYWGGTVSYMNLQLAYFLGCTEIYLIGFDHSYKVPDKINNFVITSEQDDENHIHPNYFGKGFRWHDPNLARMEQGYIKARQFFESKNIVIRNATVGGKLEIFERIDFEKLF